MYSIIGFISQCSRNLLGQLAPRKKAKKRYSEHHAMVPFFGTVVGHCSILKTIPHESYFNLKKFEKPFACQISETERFEFWNVSDHQIFKF